MTITVRALTANDRDRWQELYSGYCDFYAKPLSDERAETVFGWLLDADHELECIVAELDGQIIGLAHFREFARPIAGGRAMFLDDLFTAQEARGTGAATTLIEALREIGTERGLVMIRWLTAEDNVTAQRVYDKIARKTNMLTYDLEL